MNSGKILLSKAASADLLDISIRTLETLITAGEIPIQRIGRRVVISRRALDKFADRDHATVKKSSREVAQ